MSPYLFRWYLTVNIWIKNLNEKKTRSLLPAIICRWIYSYDDVQTGSMRAVREPETPFVRPLQPLRWNCNMCLMTMVWSCGKRCEASCTACHYFFFFKRQYHGAANSFSLSPHWDKVTCKMIDSPARENIPLYNIPLGRTCQCRRPRCVCRVIPVGNSLL